jgi:hypothetical protein
LLESHTDRSWLLPLPRFDRSELFKETELLLTYLSLLIIRLYIFSTKALTGAGVRHTGRLVRGSALCLPSVFPNVAPTLHQRRSSSAYDDEIPRSWRGRALRLTRTNPPGLTTGAEQRALLKRNREIGEATSKSSSILSWSPLEPLYAYLEEQQ